MVQWLAERENTVHGNTSWDKPPVLIGWFPVRHVSAELFSSFAAIPTTWENEARQ